MTKASIIAIIADATLIKFVFAERINMSDANTKRISGSIINPCKFLTCDGYALRYSFLSASGS